MIVLNKPINFIQYHQKTEKKKKTVNNYEKIEDMIRYSKTRIKSFFPKCLF